MADVAAELCAELVAAVAAGGGDREVGVVATPLPAAPPRLLVEAGNVGVPLEALPLLFDHAQGRLLAARGALGTSEDESRTQNKE